jgi:hypothetical protein
MAAGAGAALALAALLAFVAPQWSDPAPPEGVLVDGGAPDKGVFSADLDHAFALSGVKGADVQVRALGIPLGRGRPLPDDRVEVDLPTGEFLAGPVTVTVTGGDRDGTIIVRPTGPALGGVLTWGAPLLLLLFVVAYAESVLSRVRGRRSAAHREVGAMAGVGAVAGVALLLVSWTAVDIAVPAPVVPSVLMAAALAGGLLAPLQAALARRRGERPARRTGLAVTRR